jgi:HEAT repeat protein
MKTLGMFGPQARATLPILETRLGDANVVIKTAAAVAIWQIAPPAPQAIQALLEELHERTKPGWAIHGCSVVVEALERIGPAASSAAPSLEKLLDDPDPWSRVHAARALWKMRRDPALVVPVLTEDLLCQPVGIATGLLAAECLAEIGPAAAAAQPRIQELLAHEGSLANFGTGWVESDEAFQAALQHALHQINPTP